MDDKKEKIEVVEISEEFIKDKIYEIRNQKVMLDSDLAAIYGYENKRFNEQVRNNIEKFDSDFMFELTDEEVITLRSNFSSANISPKSRYNPHVFTEQGLYMLMTVLKGELAIKQSKALIRTFKKMKDYIMENQNLFGQREIMQWCMQTSKNKIEIKKLHDDIGSVEKQMTDIMRQLNEVVTKSDLSEMMNGFVNESDNGWLIFNAKYCSADLVYSSIYSQAKRSIYVVDNYIGLRTLVHLKNAQSGVDIKIFSDNVGVKKLHKLEYLDFIREYPKIKISIKHTAGVLHDRFIVLDYDTEDERIFLCGASSKDAGARITSIVEDFGIDKYKGMIKDLLNNEDLVLQ